MRVGQQIERLIKSIVKQATWPLFYSLIATDRDYFPVHKSAVDTDGDNILDTSQYVDPSYILGGRIVRYEGDDSDFVCSSDGTDLRFF